jgi:prepilin-type N-terminal cleavage/methylation domain-containing protein
MAIPSQTRTRRLFASSQRGFTLIELLIVVVIIGILAAISIPKFQATKGKANFAAMRADLHNLATAEESYFYERRAYAVDLDSLKFSTSHGVNVIVNEATNSGWSATSFHPDSWPRRCAVFIGGAAPVFPATIDGVVACQ